MAIIAKSSVVLAFTGLISCNLYSATLPSGEVFLQQDPASTGWKDTERGILNNQLQLTFPDRFYKAGESYFSPDDSKIIFQATEQPEAGNEPDPFYGMYIADVVYNRNGRIKGIDNIKCLSPKGTANTCGWFHPTDPNVVIFGSTIGAPSDKTPPGFERLSGRYRWMFPPEMRIVRCELDKADGTAESLELISGNEEAYQAEGSLTKDGRHLLYCSLESGFGDLFIKDTKTGKTNRIVGAEGYDGGPFFSPEQKRICYRSDRRANHYLQLFVGDLAYNEEGTIIGLENEYQLTDNEHVNWCPFWHPNGRFLVYATSRQGHSNYEIYMVDADPGNLEGSTGTIRYGTRHRRITNAAGADVLPAFNSDGSVMIWTSQRGEDKRSQLWVADFVIDKDASPVKVEGDQGNQRATAESDNEQGANTINITDPETGLIYMYDPATHEIQVYNPATHEVRDVEPDEMEHVQELFDKIRDQTGGGGG